MSTLPKTKHEEEPVALPEPEPEAGLHWLVIVFRIVLILAILGGAGYISYRWMTNPPTAQRRPPQRQATLVEVMGVAPETTNVIVKQMGTPVPARKINLAARVSGQIAEIAPDFEPGGHFQEGQMMVRIDPDDYQLAVEQQEANLVKAESELKLEMGQQSVAQLEYELLGEIAPEEDESLVLRQPQLESKKAAVAIAQAALEKARLDLERTTVEAPFNAIIQERMVELGAYVNPGTPLATLVGSDEYWVELTVPVDELRFLEIPGFNSDTGSEARLYHKQAWGAGVYLEGRVERLLTDIEPGSVMARVLLTVSDPLQLNGGVEEPHPLILGALVRVEIIGDELSGIFKVPILAVREGQYLWVMSSDNTLEIREITAAWSGEEYVYVSQGLQKGDKLVVSDLATPVAGMPLRTAEENPTSPETGPVEDGPSGSPEAQS